MSLRWRFTLALTLVVLTAVGGGTAGHVYEVSRRIELTLRQQVDHVASAIRSDLVQTSEVLDEELRYAAGAGFLKRSIGASGQARYLGARGRLRAGRLEILKVIDAATGSVLISGHWPASFGALDPHTQSYRSPPGQQAHIIDEPTPQGASPSLQRWGSTRWRGRQLLIVGGRFLDATSLGLMRERVGAGLLALCRPTVSLREPSKGGETLKGGESLTVGSGVGTMRSEPRSNAQDCVAVHDDGVMPGVSFRPDDTKWRQRFLMAPIRLVASKKGTPTLYVGLDRRDIDAVRSGIVSRAIIVAVVAILLSILLGVLLAGRVVRPIEALNEAAQQLGQGDLAVRVPVERGSGVEVKGLVETFNHMAADLQGSEQRLRQAERVAAWREIARGLAHELKNPLTPIRGAMDVIRKARALNRPDFDDILNEQAEAVVEEVARLKELADGFARFARLPDPKIESLNVALVVEHVLALYVPDTGVEVLTAFPAELPEVKADKTQLGTVVTNLVKNALEAMEKKGTLQVGLRADGKGSIELSVHDSGPGIPPAIADRLFTPYFTTKGSRGTGLGLALSHRIIVEHGGSIAAITHPDGGACFTVGLPIAGPPLAGTTPDGE